MILSVKKKNKITEFIKIFCNENGTLITDEGKLKKLVQDITDTVFNWQEIQ